MGVWEDVRSASERYLEALETIEIDQLNREAQAEEIAGSHFMGAVVLQQLPRPAAEVASWSVIDGQQRMTTLQLCLHAAGKALETLGFDGPAQRLERLVVNQFATGDSAFKLWPAAVDQEAFRAVMTDHHDLPSGSRIGEAYEFFSTQVAEWVGSAISSTSQGDRVHGLKTAGQRPSLVMADSAIEFQTAYRSG